MRLTEKIAIITGAGRGIGKEVAAVFAAEGAHPVIVDINEESAIATAKEISDSGVEALGVGGDISNPSDVATIMERTLKQFGRIDVLVNNAGVAMNTPALETTLEDWEQVIRVNLTGTFLCAQAAARIMVEQEHGGRIVNVASISGQSGAQGRVAYGVSKAGVIQLTRVMAVELGSRGVRVNAVSPGPIDTEQSRGVHTEDTRRAYLERIPLHRYGTHTEIAKAILFLASDEAGFINGHILNVDGGFYMAGLTFSD